MYHRKLEIHIFSKDTQLATVLKNVIPRERFEHKFITLSSFDPDAVYGNNDIVVLDLSWDESLQALISLAGKGGFIILCAEQHALAALPPEKYQMVNDIWGKPFSRDLLVFNFQRVLALLKLRSDLGLYQKYLDTAINSIPDLVWFKDVKGAHLKVNDGFCHAVGKSKEDIEGRGHYYIWDLKKEEYEQGEYVCLETDDAVLDAGKTCLFDEMVKSKQGLRQFKTYKSPLFDDTGNIMGTVGIAHDVTDLQNMDAELEILLRSMPFSILISDNTGRIIKANARFEKYFHSDGYNIVGQPYGTWKRALLKNSSVIRREGHEEVMLRFRGETRVLKIHEEAILDIFGTPVGQLSIFRDITIERAYERQMLRHANTDALTGLYNRRYFYEYIDKSRGTQQVNLFYIDLDDFKQVNDIYGHQKGDEALTIVGRLMGEFFPDGFNVRLGGDEFLICILGACTVEFLVDRAKKLLSSIQAQFQAEQHLKSMSASIGIALTRDPEMQIEELIKQSDAAMYEAKRMGKSQYCVYTPQISRLDGVEQN